MNKEERLRAVIDELKLENRKFEFGSSTIQIREKSRES